MTSLFRRLTTAHHMLTREIARELRKPMPDGVRLARLKKERLAVKDRLHRHLPMTERGMRFVRRVLQRMRGAHA